MSYTPIKITPARSTEDIKDVSRLFEAYVQSLGLDLAFQSYANELASLPGKYAPPQGELLLAKNAEGVVMGCVALRPLGPAAQRTCEMKRLYTVPSSRGHGVGRKLVQAILKRAAQLGYQEIKLDTLSSMTAAIPLYESLGFERTAAYYDTPLQDTIFLSCRLNGASLATESQQEARQ